MPGGKAGEETHTQRLGPATCEAGNVYHPQGKRGSPGEGRETGKGGAESHQRLDIRNEVSLFITCNFS